MHNLILALYCRVSTDEQAREGVSLDEQQTRLHAYCRAMGWHEGQVRLYMDNGYSGKSFDRPALRQLLDAVALGMVARVLVTKLDRMSRKLLDLLQMMESFRTHGVSFVSLSESFDSETPSGRLTLQVLGAVAEFERERIRERVSENMAHAALQGRWMGQSPYGYQMVAKMLHIEAGQAEIVRQVFHAYTEEQHGLFAIARHLNAQAIPSRNGKQWSVRSVKRMLSNPAYCGMLVWGGKTVEHALPALISTAQWQAAQVRLKRVKPAPRVASSPHLLSGLLRCGNCGGTLSIGWSGSTNRRRVYRCAQYKNKGVCRSTPHAAPQLEMTVCAQLANQLRHSLGPIPALRLLSVESKHSAGVPLKRQLRAAQQRYERKKEAFAEGLLTLTELQAERVKLQSSMDADDRCAQLLESQQTMTDEVAQQLAQMLQADQEALFADGRFFLDLSLPVELRRRMMSFFLSAVEVHGATKVVLTMHEDFW